MSTATVSESVGPKPIEGVSRPTQLQREDAEKLAKVTAINAANAKLRLSNLIVASLWMAVCALTVIGIIVDICRKKF